MKDIAYAHVVLNREDSCAHRRAEALAIIEEWVDKRATPLPNSAAFIAMPLKDKLGGLVIMSHMTDDVSLGSLAKVLLNDIARYENTYA